MQMKMTKPHNRLRANRSSEYGRSENETGTESNFTTGIGIQSRDDEGDLVNWRMHVQFERMEDGPDGLSVQCTVD